MSVLHAPLLYESHCHTPLCKHASGSPFDYALVAEQRGLKGIIITCHGPLPEGMGIDHRMGPEQYEEYIDLVAAAREEFAGRVDVRLGLESDFLPGYESWAEKLHARAPLHHVLGSVHMQTTYYKQRYYTPDAFAYQQTYFEHLAQSAESGLFDTLSHPDLVKNEVPAEWRFSRIEPHIKSALDRIAKTGVAMELNTSGLNKALPEMNPGPRILALIRERGIPVVLGADAHRPERVADRYEQALALLDELGFETISYFVDRRRQEVAIADALESLRTVQLTAPQR
ncbi:MAG: histidinol-phosphatase [Opitutaceae bacterium]